VLGESAPDPDTAIAGEEVTGGALVDSGPDTSLDDPLAEGKGINQNPDYRTQIASWDPVWFQVSLEDPKVKFAVSDIEYTVRPALTLLDHQACHAPDWCPYS
jgi:hypothetical protein